MQQQFIYLNAIIVVGSGQAITVIYILHMEDCQNHNGASLQQQLFNLSALQEQIEAVKRQVSQLGKLQQSQQRHLQSIYKQSITTTRNKVNQLQSHSSQHHLHTMKQQYLDTRKHEVKQFREKNQQELRQVKQMLRKSKEKEREVIKNNSLRYERTIQKNKLEDHQRKIKLVQQLRLDKENYKQTLEQSRLQQCKRKETDLFRNTLAKIDRQPSLLRQLNHLQQEKTAIQERLDQRNTVGQQVAGELGRLKKMTLQQVQEVVGCETDPGEEQRLLVSAMQSIEHLKAAILEKQPDAKFQL